jgi:hypothetical protein
MLIFELDKWTGMNESRITPITLIKFKELLKTYCYESQYLYKNIIDPKTKIGFFFKSPKKLDSYLAHIELNGIPSDTSFPHRDESLLCYNYEEKAGTVFYVIPFINTLFAISPTNRKPDSLDNCKKGYWKGQIKWLDKLPHREMWTDYPCLLIEKELWDSIKDMKEI